MYRIPATYTIMLITQSASERLQICDVTIPERLLLGSLTKKEHKQKKIALWNIILTKKSLA
jgi:hypothetical protein